MSIIVWEIPNRVKKVSLRYQRHNTCYLDILGFVLSGSRLAPWFIREPTIKDQHLHKYRDKHKLFRRMALYFCSSYAGGNHKKLRKYFRASKKELEKSLELPHRASDLIMYENVERSLFEERKINIALNLETDAVLSLNERTKIIREYLADKNKKPAPITGSEFSPTYFRSDVADVE
jgi:hypothetical protein